MGDKYCLWPNISIYLQVNVLTFLIAINIDQRYEANLSEKKGSWFVSALTKVGNHHFLVLVPKSELPQSNMNHDFENAVIISLSILI